MNVSNLQWTTDGELGGMVRINGAGPYPYDTDPGTGKRFAYLGSFSGIADLQARVDSVPKVWIEGPQKGQVFGGNAVTAGVAQVTGSIPGPRVMGVPVVLVAVVALLIWAHRTGRVAIPLL